MLNLQNNENGVFFDKICKKTKDTIKFQKMKGRYFYGQHHLVEKSPTATDLLIHQDGPYFGYFRIFTLTEAHMVQNNFKKLFSEFQVCLNFNLCPTAMQEVAHQNVLGIEISIFYTGQSNSSKNQKLCRLYRYNSSYPSEFLQIFIYYNFGVRAR